MWDVVIIGSGAGGSAMARELACAGQKVLLLEQGRDHKWTGNPVAAMQFIDRLGFRMSREGLMIVRALTTGGSTMIYGACATRPPDWMLSEYGIDLGEIAKKIEKTLNVRPTPAHLMGPGVRLISDAARRLGLAWNRFPKFVDFEKCSIRCGNCMTGCPTGAKWTARHLIDQARACNCRIVPGFRVHKVTQARGKVRGVYGKYQGRSVELQAGRVILAAGGLGTPVILQRSGLDYAGQHFFCDPMRFVYGAVDKPKGACDIPNTAGSFQFHDKDGIFLADHTDPALFYPVQIVTGGLRHLPKLLDYRKTIGILVKIKDTPGGRIYADGSFSKPLTRIDHEKLDKGVDIAEKILLEAGVKPSSMVTTAVRGAHPGGSAGIGRVVDTNLETEIKNLYVCDASVLPKSMASPQVLTLLSLARRLAVHLEGRRPETGNRKPETGDRRL